MDDLFHVAGVGDEPGYIEARLAVYKERDFGGLSSWNASRGQEAYAARGEVSHISVIMNKVECTRR